MPAERVGIRDRGRIARGLKADVVALDPETVRERGTLENPSVLSEGVSHVVVNGGVTMADGKLTGSRSGRVPAKELADMLAKDVDPITFEVIHNGLDSLVDEMALTIMRTAHSGVVKDAMDYSTAFCDRRGQVIAAGGSPSPCISARSRAPCGRYSNATTGRSNPRTCTSSTTRTAPAGSTCRTSTSSNPSSWTTSSRASPPRWRTTPTSAGSCPAATRPTR